MDTKPKVLLIDNAKMMHGVVKARLAADGIDFYSAYSGEEGLTIARAIEPDVILLDVQMPPPDGFEVCRELKSDHRLSTIPVIFLSGNNTTEEKVRGLNLGAIDYVTKPFDAAELQARVRASLRNKELLDLLSNKAMIDGLTGLWNRAYMNQRLVEELANAKRHGTPLSCIMIDVDHFKSVNDTHGHGFGDLVLKGVGKILHKLGRSEDVVCRYGGEEFVVLARSTDATAAMSFAERLRAGVQASVFTRGPISISVTCSLGVAVSRGDDGDLVERADRALYDSKQNGRNRATLSEDQSAKAA